LNKRILFLTGTRADFGKLHPLMDIVESSSNFKCYIFVTGMHTLKRYGSTYHEITKSHYENIQIFKNQNYNTSSEKILSNTINGLKKYVQKIKPDMIVVHGDRIETLAGAIVGSFNNILVCHIEGGELSGTVDELIRHAVTKLSHIHFVANIEAKNRLIQLGEIKKSIHIIGSPDIDVMRRETLPTLEHVKSYYGIEFSEYAILIFHPVVTELSSISTQINTILSCLRKEKMNFIVILPNNDPGSEKIFAAYNSLDSEKFLIFPSIRFQYFLTLLKNANYIIGNSSAGIREAEVYGTPTINIGSRQFNRSSNKKIINISSKKNDIKNAINSITGKRFLPRNNFGNIKNSDKKFIEKLNNKKTWNISIQKQFIDFR